MELSIYEENAQRFAEEYFARPDVQKQIVDAYVKLIRDSRNTGSVA